MSDGTSWRSLNAPFDEDGFALVKRDIETLFLKQYPYIQDGNSSPSFSYKTESLPVSPIDFSGGGGVNGTSATVAIGSTTTGAPGSSASVTNSGDTTNAIFNFTIPAGANGAAATVAVGTTTTGAAGPSASVTNSGSTSAAVFNFTIPRGDTGATGATGPAGPGFTNGTSLGDTKVWNTSGSTWDNATAGTALSVFGRSANTNGLPSAIVAATSGHVLRYTGTALAWGSVNLAGTNDVTGTLPIGRGGTNATSSSAGTIPNASSSTAASWTVAPSIGVAGTSLGSVTIESANTTAASRMRVVVAGNEISIYSGGTTSAELIMTITESDLSFIAAGAKGATNCIKARVISECDSTGAAKSRIYLCSAQY